MTVMASAAAKNKCRFRAHRSSAPVRVPPCGASRANQLRPVGTAYSSHRCYLPGRCPSVSACASVARHADERLEQRVQLSPAPLLVDSSREASQAKCARLALAVTGVMRLWPRPRDRQHAGAAGSAVRLSDAVASSFLLVGPYALTEGRRCRADTYSLRRRDPTLR